MAAARFDENRYEIPGRVSSQDVREMREAFELLDEDRSGYVNIRELRAAIVALGLSVESSTVTEIMQEVGGSDANLDFDEFYKLMTEEVTGKETVEEIMQIFMLFDEDRSGTISVDNLEKVAFSLGEKLDRRQLQEMCSLLDSDGDGEISPEDFYFVMTRGVEERRARQAQAIRNA
eukprot:TRINITY_DN24997_c0_g1_i1.p1 TRINITY_DN24997_c0_g1~~TRINITY_DN24997_c0_g1_i1.p1  ORF type:complete len:176 (-),score=30.44 TRINITY_DN24997_c0_g1_i1:156-683(-)